MGKITGYLEYPRVHEEYAPVKERVLHFKEFIKTLPRDKAEIQAARCMSCGTPFCTNACPLHNVDPDFSDAIYNKKWKEAYDILSSTNNFPEITGRICPALCEASCALAFNDEATGNKSIERSIIDHAWEDGYVLPEPSPVKTGKKIAVIGSGPSGLACAQQLARAGHDVTVFEKNDRIGGLMRLGIPDFKLSKALIDRRAEQMKQEGVTFVLNTFVGKEGELPQGVHCDATRRIDPAEIMKDFDAVVLSGGSETPRDLKAPGRELKGVHFALEYLIPQNKEDSDGTASPINVKDKTVVVIGGGDTGSDCVGTALRQGAKFVHQIELFPEPPREQNKLLTWPDWPRILRTSSSHEEGTELGRLDRLYALNTKAFIGENGSLKKLRLCKIKLENGRPVDIPDTEFEMEADYAFLAMGFLHPTDLTLDGFGVAKDKRGNAAATYELDTGFRTSVDKVFAAGDMRRGQSLVVWAISEGRRCAREVDRYLMGDSCLPPF